MVGCLKVIVIRQFVRYWRIRAGREAEFRGRISAGPRSGEQGGRETGTGCDLGDRVGAVGAPAGTSAAGCHPARGAVVVAARRGGGGGGGVGGQRLRGRGRGRPGGSPVAGLGGRHGARGGGIVAVQRG